MAQRGVVSVSTLAPVCLVLAALSGCGSPPVDGCLDLLAGGRKEEAVQACQHAFELGGDPRAGLAAARALYALGEPQRALEQLAAIGDSPKIAGADELAGRIHRERGDAGRAIEAYERAARLYRESGKDRDAFRASYTVFYLSWEQARYREAFRGAWRSYEDALRAADRALEATALGGLASTLFEVGDLEGTQRVVRAALEALPSEEGTDRGRLLNLEGLVQLRNGRPAVARASFEQALRSAGPGASPRFFRSVHLNHLDADLLLGDLESAERHLEEMRDYVEPGTGALAERFYRARLALARDRLSEAAATLDAALEGDPDPGWRWMLHYRRGQAREGLGDWQRAERDYAAAAGILEELRRELDFDVLKVWLLDERREPFEALVALEARHRGPAAALDTVERAKARVFVDALVRSARADPSAEGALELGHELLERAGALAELMPALQASTAVEVRPLDQLLAELPGRLVLEYFVAGDEVWLFRVGDGEVVEWRLDASAAELTELARQFRATPDDAQLAERLGLLLLPEDLALRRGTRLSIVTDGVLGSVPFAALRRRGRFLVEGQILTYAPSLNGLASVMDSPRREGGAIQVVGDPLGDLPAAASEVREVAEELGGQALVGTQAALAALEPASSVRLLHVATHTGLGPTGPWLTLADGVVDAGAVLAGSLGGEIVVLASCASAAREGKGLWGSLGSAFLAAGSRSVVAALWSVEDRATSRLVRLFYANGGDRDPARALALAQRQLIVAEAPASAWAAFVVFGSNEPIPVN